MKTLKKHLENKKVLFDGVFTNEIYSPKSISLSSGKILNFSPKDFEGKKLKIFFTEISEEDKQRILSEGDISNTPPSYLSQYMKEDDLKSLNYEYYSSEPHLNVEYLIKDNFLLLFTFGEKQPSRWVLVLEGVWGLLG